MSEFDIAEMLTAEDSSARAEAFVEALMSAINSDDEPWGKKGYYITKALLDNDANALLVALCGWSGESIAKKAMLIRDTDKMFHTDPVPAEMQVEWSDGHRSASPCKMNPVTHEVYDFAKAAFECEGECTVKQVYLMVESVDDVFEFICVQAENADAVTSKSVFWYNPENYGRRTIVDERYITHTVHISEVKAGDIILYANATHEATTDAFQTKTEIGKEWNFEVDGSDYIWASYLDGAMVEIVDKVERVICTPEGEEIKFTCDNGLAKYADSMLHDTNTIVASMSYDKGGIEVELDLMVRGEVHVRLRGEDYRKPSCFPKELRKMIEENPNEWDKKAQSYDLIVLMNNWFEFIYTFKSGGKQINDGIMSTYNLQTMTADELREEMVSLCRVIADEQNN